MPSPVRTKKHGAPHIQLATWIGTYAAETPGIECADNATVRLDLDNEPQPDLMLLKLPEKGGLAHISADDYTEGPPELVVEIVGSSRAYDLHQKKGAYRRNGVREYLAWITGEHGRTAQKRRLSSAWFGGNCARRNIKRSPRRPGLWLDSQALLKGDLKAVLALFAARPRQPGVSRLCRRIGQGFTIYDLQARGVRLANRKSGAPDTWHGRLARYNNLICCSSLARVSPRLSTCSRRRSMMCLSVIGS